MRVFTKTKIILKGIILTIALFLSITNLISCGAGGGAGGIPGEDVPLAPPAPPIEVPTTFAIPNSVAINIDNVRPDPVAAVSSLALGSGPLSGTIGKSFEFLDTSNQLIEVVLGALSEFQIPVSADTKSFEVETIGEFNGLPITFKFDFADFDLDGNGQTEGCTGCTCPKGCVEPCPDEIDFVDLEPICYRIWQKVDDGDYLRFLSGIINVFTTQDDASTEVNESNAGVGKFRFNEHTLGDFDQSFSIGADYDHFDLLNPFDKTNDVFAQDIIIPIDNPDDVPTKSIIRNFMNQIGLNEAQSESDTKTLYKTYAEFYENNMVRSTVDIIGQFLGNGDFWSGTIDDPNITTVNNICARLSTANIVNNDLCLDANIDVGDEEFLDPPDQGFLDEDFLLDFPPMPTI